VTKQPAPPAKPTLSSDHRTDNSAPHATTLSGRSVRFSAISFPVLAAGAYTISSILASLLISRDHCRLPRLQWADVVKCNDKETSDHTSSIFVIIAEKSSIPGLGHVYNGIIVFAALTCANTNLYVASRSLFGLTARLEGGSHQPLYLRILAQFGKTNKNRVPIRAVIASALAFCWVPFIQYIKSKRGTEVCIHQQIPLPAIKWTLVLRGNITVYRGPRPNGFRRCHYGLAVQLLSLYPIPSQLAGAP
jgi:amino acid transporter